MLSKACEYISPSMLNCFHGFFLVHFFFYSFWCLSSSSLAFCPTKSMVSNFLRKLSRCLIFLQHFFIIQPVSILLDIYLKVFLIFPQSIQVLGNIPTKLVLSSLLEEQVVLISGCGGNVSVFFAGFSYKNC